MLRRRLLIEWWAIAVLTAVLTGALVLTSATSRLDNAAYDLLQGWRAAPPSDRIIIVAIDDASIAAIGPWPWPRAIHARAIDRIAAAKPAVVAYDVLFTEPTTADATLATALRQVPSVLPLLAETPGLDGRALDLTPPVEPVRSAATAIGHVVLPHDEDGTARDALLAIDDGRRVWPHVMEEAYRLAFHRSSAAFVRAEQKQAFSIAIPYQAFAGGFRTVPFESVLSGDVPPAFFRDHIVLVGATAAGLGDRHSVPTRGGAGIAGIEVQANLLNALIADRTIREVPMVVRLFASIMPSLLLLIGFWRLRPSRALGASATAILLMLLLPAGLLVTTGFWMPPAPALLGLLLVYPLWGWRRLQTVDSAIARELARFTADGGGGAPHAWPDSADGHAAQLSSSIAQLRDLRQLIADTIEGVADPLIVTTLDAHVLLANAAAEQLLKQGLSLPEGEWTDDIALEDGRSFSPRRTPLLAGDGTQRGWIHLLAEITAIRRAEQEREQALEFLSHDMRSPQAAIITLIEGDPERAAAPAIAERIVSHARRTLALADDFVQLARLRHARFEPEETDLCDSLAEAMDAAWPVASKRGVRIVAEGADEPRCVMGERDALTRALVNLLDNAVKFSPPEGQVRCRVGLSPEGDWVEVEIADDGPGMPPDRADAIFARFGSTVRRGAGPTAGLGLAYVREAIDRHGGMIAYTPAMPRGARFLIRLPAYRNRDAGRQPGESAA